LGFVVITLSKAHEETKNTYKSLVGTPAGKDNFGVLAVDWKIILKSILKKEVEQIHVAQDRGQWLVL
jgi:hypothetical protein